MGALGDLLRGDKSGSGRVCGVGSEEMTEHDEIVEIHKLLMCIGAAGAPAATDTYCVRGVKDMAARLSKLYDDRERAECLLRDILNSQDVSLTSEIVERIALELGNRK